MADPTLVLGANVLNGATAAEATQLGGVVLVTGDAGVTLTIVFKRTISGQSDVVVTTTAQGSGVGSVPVSLSQTDLATLGDGLIDVAITEVDGVPIHIPPAVSFNLDTSPPALPVITQGTGVGNGATKAEATQATGVVLVTGEIGANIEVVFTPVAGGTPITKSVTGAGALAVAVVLADADLQNWVDGQVTVQARQFDAAGNASSDSSTSFNLVTAVPAAPTINLGTGVATGATKDEATQATGVVQVTGDVGVGIEVVFARTGGGSVTKTVTGAGVVPVPVVLAAADAQALGDGLITVSARQFDTAGNFSVPSTTSFPLVSAVPAAPTITSITDNVGGTTGVVPAGGRTDDTNLDLSVALAAGTAAGDALQLFDGSTSIGAPYVLTQNDISSGSATLVSGLLTNGTTYNFNVKLTDVAGNTSLASTAYSVTIDATPPTLSSQYPAANATGVPRNSGIVLVFSEPVVANGGTVLVQSGTTSLATVYTLTLTGTSGAVGSGGSWVIAGNRLIIDPPGSSNTFASNTTYRVNIGVNALKDLAGNALAGFTTSPFTTSLISDIIAPTKTVASLAFSADTGALFSDVFFTNQSKQIVSGTLSANPAADELVQISIDNGATWQYADTFSTTTNQFSHAVSLTGSSALRARVVDAAGNAGTALSRLYTLDTSVVPPGIVLGGGVADVASAAEATQAAGVVTVTGEIGATISVRFVGPLGGGGVSKTVTGNGATPVPVVLTTQDLSALGDGSIAVTARQVDLAGNSSAESSISFWLDTLPPTSSIVAIAFSVDTAGQDTTGTASDLVTNQASQTIRGNLSAPTTPGETVKISLDDGVTWITATNSSGSADFSLDVTLTASSILRVKVQDSAGNDGPVFSQAYVLDTQVAPPGLALAAGVDRGATATEATVTGAVVVTGEVGAAIHVVFTGPGDPPGQISKQVIGAGATPVPVLLDPQDLLVLGDGLISVEATQTDPADNGSLLSPLITFNLDTAAPAAPQFTTAPFSTNALSHTITGTAEPYAVIRLSDVRAGVTEPRLVGTTTADAQGRWEALVYLVGQGQHTITATATDEAGNPSVSSLGLAVTVDRIAPTSLMTKEDLQYILLQIGVAEAHNQRLGGDAGIRADYADGVYNIVASQEALRWVLNTGAQAVQGAPAGDAQPFGLRSVEGINNNLQPNQAPFGASDRTFSPATSGAVGVPTLPRNYDGDGAGPNPAYTLGQNVTDATPRLISNLIADQTTSNPAAVAAGKRQQSLLDPELQRSANPKALATQFDVVNQPIVPIPDVAPNPVNAPLNAFHMLFGQGVDHGLDLIDKGGSGTVTVPLLPGDPLYVAGSPTNFIKLTRATVDAQGLTTNRTTPLVDMNQAFGSHRSMNVFIREYVRPSGVTLATGRLLDGQAGGLPTWLDIKQQALSKLGLILTDQDVGNCPMIVADEYGRMIPGPNGYAQVVVRLSGGTPSNPVLEIREGTANGLPLSTADYAALGTGHAFLLDMAHTAAPASRTADPDTALGLSGSSATYYDNELLDRHFVAGDGRVNENQGLTSFHLIFHNEHGKFVEEYKRIAVESGDLQFLNAWLRTPRTTVPATVAEIPASQWDGERLYQAARFMVEGEYQHGVFEEFSLQMDPNLGEDTGYNINIDPAITSEFANATFRFGHSIATEWMDRFSPDWQNTSKSLISSFVNPVAFLDPDGDGINLTAAQAGGEILRGMTRQQNNAIDEFTTGALRNHLLGLALDLVTLNTTRARELGVPRLNSVRSQFFAATNNSNLAPYNTWTDFKNGLRHPESLQNFVAAYGRHPELDALRDPANPDPDRVNKLRTIALALINGTHADSANFMNATGSARSNAAYRFTDRRAGLDDIDLWIGGLAEKPQAQIGMLGSTFAFIFTQQFQALRSGDRLYYTRRLPGNLLTQVEQNTFASMAQRNLNVSGLPGQLFKLPTYTLEADPVRQYTALGNGKADPVGTNRLLAGPAEIGFTVANSLRWQGSHVVLNGTESADLLQGGDENDTLWGLGSGDVMIGGLGDDQFFGGEGSDYLFDDAGLNIMRGEAGSDVIISNSGFSVLYGGTGKDWLMGGAGGLGNEMFGETEDDFLAASDAGSFGNAGGGDDWFEGHAQGGVDKINLDDGMGIKLNINGNAVPQAIGHDVSLSRAGDDRVFGDYGNDIFIDGSGSDDYSGQMGFDWISFARNRKDPGGSNNLGGSIDLSLVIPAAAVRPGVQSDFTDNRVEAAAGSEDQDTLIGDDRTDLVGGNVFLNRNNDLVVDGRDRNIVAPDGLTFPGDLVRTGNNRTPVVQTHYAVNPLTGQWGPAGGISVQRSLDDRLFDLPLESGGIRGLFTGYTSSAANGGAFPALLPAALIQDQEVNTRPHPQGTGINIVPVIVGSATTPAGDSTVPGMPGLAGTVTVSKYFNAGNVLIAGGGSDTVFSKGGDDVIDGDAWLNVELEWRNPADPTKTVRFKDMREINAANLISGLAIRPEDVYLVRELASNPFELDGVTRSVDTAVYYGRPDEYLFEGQRRVYVTGVSGTTLTTNGDDYQEDPVTGAPLNYPNILGVPRVREVDLNGANLAATFVGALNINFNHPRTTIVGQPVDVNGDGFITLTYAPTSAQLADPLRQVAPAPGVALPILQGTDYLRNIENVRFVSPAVANPTRPVSDPFSQLVAPTVLPTYTSQLGAATYTYSTFRDGTYVDIPVAGFVPSTTSVAPGVGNTVAPLADPATLNAIHFTRQLDPLPGFSVGLVTDTGTSSSDSISQKADIRLSSLPDGYLYQWSNVSEYYSPAWKAIPGSVVGGALTIPESAFAAAGMPLSQGANTLYFRLVENKDGGRIGASQPFSFTYDTTAPVAAVQTGAGYTAPGGQVVPDSWRYEAGATLYYGSSASGPFAATSQPAARPYFTQVEDLAGNRSPSAQSSFFYNIQAPAYNDGVTTTPGNNSAGTGYLLITNYKPGEGIMVDIGAQVYHFVDNYTTADNRNGIGVFLDDGTGSGRVVGGWDRRDELLALIQAPDLAARMFAKSEIKNGSGAVTSRSYSVDPLKVKQQVFTTANATVRDNLVATAGGVADQVKLVALADALLPASSTNLAASFDRVTGLNTAEDIIDSPVARTSPISPNVRTTAVTALTTAGISRQLTTSTLVANGAATFVFGSGAAQRTFLALGDGTAGFGAGDAVIELVTPVGSLASLLIY